MACLYPAYWAEQPWGLWSGPVSAALPSPWYRLTADSSFLSLITRDTLSPGQGGKTGQRNVPYMQHSIDVKDLGLLVA